MKVRIISALFVTVALTLSCFSAAHAYCDNKNPLTVYSQIAVNSDGSKDVLVSVQDKDYYPGGTIYLYQNGQFLQSATNGYITRHMPKGAGNWDFSAANYNSCGSILNVVPVFRTSN